MAITVANPFNAFLQGRQARSQMDQDERKNALLDMQIANAPQEQAQRNKLLDLQVQGAQQDITSQQARDQAAQAGATDQRKQRAIGQLSNLSRQALSSKDPRAFVAQAAQNPAYAEFFKDVGMDPRNVDVNSPSFEQDLQTWASLGDQPSAEARFNRETAQMNRESDRAFQERTAREQRDFIAQQNELNRQNQRDITGMRNDPNAPGNKPKITEGERTSANYLLRMGQAEPLIAGYKPSVKDQVAFSRALNSNSELVSALGNSALSPEAQSYYQGASDWVRAKLRKESGAVIAPSEMVQEIKTYFPMPGDSDKVIEQKRQARLTAQEGMRGMAGGAAPPQEPPPDQGGAPKQIKSEAEYGALPSGAKYIGPDGKMRQKR